MSHDVHSVSTNAQTVEVQDPEGVSFDPEKIVLEGRYVDQLSAYRAKKLWIETLETSFLLEIDHDFQIIVKSDIGRGHFRLECKFCSACARYAFWRLTNHQAPEAQYIIETAHIPLCESRHDDMLRAPDLRSIHGDPLVLNGLSRPRRPSIFLRWLQEFLK